jgi:3-mercaptopyruvate sulfurtransferase SseA
MRYVFLCCLGLLLALGLLAACNSNESLVTQSPKATGSASKAPGQTPQTAQNPPDNARRITAEELHALWEKNEVLIVDTRNEPSFKQGHIRGAVLIPTTEFDARSGELPRNKTIVTYCA